MIRNQRTITFNIFSSFGSLDIVLSLLYLRWLLRYFIRKTFDSKQFNSDFSIENLLLQDIHIKTCESWVHRGYDHLRSFKLQNKEKIQPQTNLFLGLAILFLSNLLLCESRFPWKTLSTFVQFRISLSGRGWQIEWNFFCHKKTT